MAPSMKSRVLGAGRIAFSTSCPSNSFAWISATRSGHVPSRMYHSSTQRYEYWAWKTAPMGRSLSFLIGDSYKSFGSFSSASPDQNSRLIPTSRTAKCPASCRIPSIAPAGVFVVDHTMR